MDAKNLRARTGGTGESENIEKPVIYEREQEKMDAEIKDIFRIRVIDASAFKNSYNDWADQWK